MATWGTNGLTNRGRVLQNKAQAGVQLKYTKIVIGDGQLGNQSIGPLLGVISSKMTIPITRLRVSGDSALIGMTFNNDAVTVGFTWREIGIYAQDPDVGEIMYWYANAGTTGSYIPPGGGSDIVEMSYDQNVFVGTAQNITAEINESLVYATRQELDEVLQESKTYTDTQIANFQVPDATTTVKGKVMLSNAISDTSQTKAVTPYALKSVYDLTVAGMRLRNVNSGTNLDTLTQTGLYRIAEKAKYPNAPDDYGILQVNADTPGYVTQTFITVTTAKFYYRGRREGGEWTAWNEVAASPLGDVKSPMVFRGQVAGDFNNYTQTGYYIVASDNWTGVINFPRDNTVGNAYPYGVLEVINSGQGLSQLYRQHADSRVWTRGGYNNGSWAGWKRLLTTDDYDTLFQSGANAKQIIVDSVNAKRGSASTSMSWAEVGTAIRSAGPLKGTINNSYQITEYATPPQTRVYSPVWFTFPANTSVITFTATDQTNSYMFTQRRTGSTNDGSAILLFRDANGTMVDFLRIVKASAGLGGDSDRFTVGIRWITLDARAREIRLYWYEPRLTSVPIPANFDFTRPIDLLAGAVLNNNSDPTVYGTGLKGDLLYQ